jgi:hypothetical protein
VASWTRHPVRVISRLARLADRFGLGCLAEQLVQLSGPDGRDQGINHPQASLSLDWTTMPALALLELDELGPELDEHDNLTRGIDLPPGPDGLLLVPCLSLSTLTHRWTGPDVVGIFQKELLLFQLRDELGPALLDGIVSGL